MQGALKGMVRMQAKNILSKTVIIISLCAFFGSAFAAPASKILTKNEELYPQGWSVGDQVKFKKGTMASLNENGSVITGVLASDTYLRPQGWQRIINDYYSVAAYTDRSFFFPHYYRYWNNSSTYNIALPSSGHIRYKDGTAVTFSEQGTVLSGTIADKTTIGIGEGQYGFVDFKSDSVLTFYDNGAVKTGTLSEDTKLRPVGWKNNALNMENAGFVEFKAKSVVNLTQNGEVTSCTVKNVLKWKNGGMKVELPPNVVINFTEQGAEVVTK
jgi:hypothetical protein